MITVIDQAAVVERYIAMRDAKAVLKAKYEADKAKYDQGMDKIEKWLLTSMNESGQLSVKTAAGTAYKKTTSSATVADWDIALSFIKENELWNMLDKRVNKTAVDEYRAANDDLPPGLNWREAVVVQILRS